MNNSSVYFAGRTVDWLLVGGLSLLVFLVLKAAGTGVAAIDVNLFLVSYLVWVGNAPHFAATCQRLYRSRASVGQYPFTAAVVPFVVLAAVFLSVQYPNRIAPAFIKLYLLWSPYHYAGQALGLALLYFRRADFPLTPRARTLLATLLFSIFLTSVATTEAEVTRLAFFGITYPTLGIPRWIPLLAETSMWASGAALVAVLMLASRRSGKKVPLIALVPVVALYVWFVRGPMVSSYFQLVPFFHGVQYLLVAWFAEMRERTEGAGVAPTTRRLVWESVRWGVVAVLGGAFLFSIFPYLVQLGTRRDLLLVMPIAIAGVQIHHFFVDGVIWKLKNPRVLSPLLGGLRRNAPTAHVTPRAA